MKPQLPWPRLAFLLLLTLIYLAFELAFNARLLDVVSAQTSLEHIDSIENYGRFLSGCAAALFVFGWGYKQWAIHTQNQTLAADLKIALLLTITIALSASCIGLIQAGFPWPIPVWLAGLGCGAVFLVVGFILARRLFVLWRNHHPWRWALLGSFGLLLWHESWDHLAKIALALFCVGATLWLLRHINKMLLQKEHAALNTTLLATAATLIGVFFMLQTFVEHIVDRQGNEMRRMAFHTVLLQNGLQNGRITLAGLEHQSARLAEPQGKAFMALFPLFSLGAPQLEDKIRPIRAALVTDFVERKIGGAKQVMNTQYEPAMEDLQQRWQRYREQRPITDITPKVQEESQRQWHHYTLDLARHHWTPHTIPRIYQSKVRTQMRKKLATLPADWHPSDRLKFNQAVVKKIQQDLYAADGSMRLDDQTRLPGGLDFDHFVAQPFFQHQLQKKLALPKTMTIKAQYKDAQDFIAHYYQPFLLHLAQPEIAKYERSPADFGRQGALAKEGKQALNKTLVPALALLFSLLGGITHLSKLLMLLALPMTSRLPQSTLWNWSLMLIFVVSACAYLLRSHNDITRSEVYQQVSQKMLEADSFWQPQFARGLHMILLGQGMGYPWFDGIRIHVLRGISYGYDPELSTSTKPP